MKTELEVYNDEGEIIDGSELSHYDLECWWKWKSLPEGNHESRESLYSRAFFSEKEINSILSEKTIPLNSVLPREEIPESLAWSNQEIHVMPALDSENTKPESAGKVLLNIYTEVNPEIPYREDFDAIEVFIHFPGNKYFSVRLTPDHPAEIIATGLNWSDLEKSRIRLSFI